MADIEGTQIRDKSSTYDMGGPVVTLGLSPTHRGYSLIDTLSNETFRFMLLLADVKLLFKICPADPYDERILSF
jgi:hypothetical protein